ncbi:MAG TPA: polysaccharide deacetylase family protein, partial [Kiritimatiellia bacterium]|nr:polysaccharide deacetylase family protein [Kiritimatiellia bacterium]
MNLWLKKHLYHLAVPFLVRRARRNNLCFGVSYHRFESVPGADPKPGMAVTPELFRKHIEILRELGSFISIDDAVSEKRPDGISFVLSFDDGYRDNLTILLPILEELNVPCCLYVTSGLVSGELTALDHDKRAGFCPPVLNPADLKALSAHPLMTIGSHTQNHVRLSTLDAGALEAELKTSRDWFQKKAE